MTLLTCTSHQPPFAMKATWYLTRQSMEALTNQTINPLCFIVSKLDIAVKENITDQIGYFCHMLNSSCVTIY
jgi:hypothetical protein